jgi:hypothetical protein
MHNVRAEHVLRIVAEEEAAKYLMLLDAARCTRAERGGHLGRFYQHLARGIYARSAEWRSATYREHLRYVDLDRHSLYLDGPNDVDWIFRNDVLEERESALYVDYVESEDGLRWQTPATALDGLPSELEVPSAVILLAQNLNAAGYSSGGALRIVNRLWAGRTLSADMHHGTVRDHILGELREFDAAKLPGRRDPGFAHALTWQSPFPLHQADLSEIRVTRGELEEQRRSHGGG